MRPDIKRGNKFVNTTENQAWWVVDAEAQPTGSIALEDAADRRTVVDRSVLLDERFWTRARR